MSDSTISRARLLTTPIDGLHNFVAMLSALDDDPDAIKVYVEVAPGLG